MNATEIQTRIAQLERRIRTAEIQGARCITLEILCSELADLKRAAALTEINVAALAA